MTQLILKNSVIIHYHPQNMSTNDEAIYVPENNFLIWLEVITKLLLLLYWVDSKLTMSRGGESYNKIIHQQ